MNDDDDLDDWASDEWMEKFEKKIKNSVDKIYDDSGNYDIVVFERKNGMTSILHQTSNSGSKAWQVSLIAADGIPTYHTLFKTRSDALESIGGGGLSPAYGYPGEWRVIEKRNIRKKK